MSATAASGYEDFIRTKKIVVPDAGFEPLPLVVPAFPFQAQNIRWAIRRGRAALFCDTGLGKTLQQLEWARQVAIHTGKPTIILAPLAVSHQTVREGARFGVPVVYARDASEVSGGVVITNYERLHKFDASVFGGVVIDESGIIKNYSGALKGAIFEAFKNTAYKLACSATPAPNDHLELGNHAEFLDVMSSHQMIARWFINDTSTFGTYRLKGHAVESFWDWVSSWAVMASLPSDVGPFDDSGYVLPTLTPRRHEVDVDIIREKGDALTLFRMPELSATSIHTEKRRTADDRAKRVAELVAAEPDEAWLIWSETDYEADALLAAIPDLVDVRGSDSPEAKEKALLGFSDGTIKRLSTKAKIAGFGLNWQHCARVAFVGATFSFEAYYQAIRRVWRYGQKRPVDVHIVMASTERSVWDILNAKIGEFEKMKSEMFKAAKRAVQRSSPTDVYDPSRTAKLPVWMRK